MLADYQNMTTPMLVDLLAQHTQKITQLISLRHFDKEYEHYKEAIKQIQEIIQSRNETSLSNESPVNFTKPDSTL